MRSTRRSGELLLFPDLWLDQPAASVEETPPEARSHALPAAPDQAARDAALDAERSWIVQAPAGAGKTELLTQRYLTLLATVDEPEEILAITFTRAATAEMRGRVLLALEQASALRDAPEPSDEPKAVQLARRVLAHAEQRGWQLLEQPHRLDVQTIDSLCMRLAHGQPLLARLGGRLEPTEQAAALYTLAARRTLERLGHANAALDQALRHLLLLRDNNLGECRRLIAALLEDREQWRHIFVLSEGAEVDWSAARAGLEAPFAAEVERVLGGLHAIFAAEPALIEELLTLGRYACSHGSRLKIDLLDGLQTLPAPDAFFVDHWQCLHNLLLTRGRWRKAYNGLDGFPCNGNAAPKKEQREYRKRMEDVANRLAAHPAGERLRALLCRVRTLPAPRYDEQQWETLVAVFRVLRQAVAELHVVFAERNQVDFAELSIAAATVLDDEESGRGLLASEVRRHLLVDEFQDTSRPQHQLIGRLLREWRPGDGRTCFLVGDPMQSIYVFRQAEVELFGRVQRRGLDCGSHTHPCAGLTLSENFRSHAGLVEPLNRHFTTIFATAAEGARGEVPFSPSTSTSPAPPGHSLAVHAFSATRDPESRRQARAAEVARVVALVEDELPRIAQAQRDGLQEYKVAVLGRAKNHLAPIAEALRDRSIPYRAVELETLNERQEILDLQMLLRALLHPADRIAWLSVLRAPWCGLTLGDLHQLTGAEDRGFRARLVPELMTERAPLLSADGQTRLARVAAVLSRAMAERCQVGQSLSAWLERAWMSLGAPAYLSATERANAEAFFNLLEQMPGDGIDVWNGALDTALSRLCAAPDAGVDESCGVQLMTIHKAKGLGFDVVIVPSLERSAGNDGSPLVTILERTRQAPDAAEEVDEVLVAPLGRHGEKHRTYAWVQAQHRLREAAERKRVFYVACTRARRTLHLLGVADQAAGGTLRAGKPNSLLACAWPALGPLFAEQLQEAAVERADNAAIAPGIVERLAAAGIGEAAALRLERVPSRFSVRVREENVTVTSTFTSFRGGLPTPPAPLERPHGSPEQRARGNAVHSMLELVSEAWARSGVLDDVDSLTPRLRRAARATLRRAGLGAQHAHALSESLVAVVRAAVTHAEGGWVLAPHPGAESEWSLSSWLPAQGGMRTMRVDRVFRAGREPLSDGEEFLWIVDYKTGAEPGGIALDAYLEKQKTQWRPQLEGYGEALRGMRGSQLPLRYALYFPEIQRLVWWSE